MRFPAQRWFPKDAVIRNYPEAALVVAVVAANASGRPQAVGYFGNAQRPSFNYSFRSTEQMETYLAERVESGKASLALRSARKAERRAKLAEPNPLAVGDVLLNSWGYEQTNADFYQVTALVGKRSVKIRRIASQSVPGTQGFMSEMVKPVPGAFLEKEPVLMKRVDESGRVRIESYASAGKFDPNGTTYSSWYA